MGLLDLIGHKYPFTDFHELNLDWCITAVLQLQKAFEDFSAGNKLYFADPLQHDLTKTYAKNTIVLDADGNAYLSLDTVPKGVQLSNAYYWLMVFNFEEYTEKANKNFTVNYFRDTTRTPYSLDVGDWCILDDVLYKVTVAIPADDLFEVGINIVHFTVEQFLKDFVSSVNQTLTNWYNQMTGTINQYKNDIDASELLYRQQLAQDIANTTASLQAQLNAAIAGVTVDSEVINARVGADGVTYPTLGDAIRTQDSKFMSEFDEIKYVEKIAFIGDNVYDKADATTGATKTTTDNSVTFTITSDPFNGSIFSPYTTPLPFINEDQYGDYFVFEFDVDTDAENIVAKMYNPGSGGTVDYPITGSGHYKIPSGVLVTNFFLNSTDDVGHYITLSNIICYQGSVLQNPLLYKDALDGAKAASVARTTSDVNIIALNNELVYKNAIALNGTKTAYDDTSVSYTIGPTPTPNLFNAILFSAGTTPFDIENNDYSADTLVFECDVETTASYLTLRFTKAGGMLEIPVKNGQHIKYQFPTEYNSYLYFADLNNSDANKTVKISNVILYQGDIYNNPFAYDDHKSNSSYKKILTIGDSLTNINGNAGTGSERWQNEVIKKCNFTGYITEGAVGFTVATLAGQSSIYDVVQALTYDSDVDFITFWGGTNDWAVNIQLGDFEANLAVQDNSKFYGALISCVKKLMQLYPSKRLVLIGTTPRMLNSEEQDWSTTKTNTNGDTLVDFVDAVKKVAEYFGLPFIDLMRTSGINIFNYATYLYQQQYVGHTEYYYLHFTDYAEVVLGNQIAGFINLINGN